MTSSPTTENPREAEAKPPFPQESLEYPGLESEMSPRPDYGEESYQGHGRLQGRVALITGGDSGIGRAVALAFAREGADVLISYLNEDSDAEETARVVREAGRQAVLAPGDISEESHCRSLVERTVSELGKLDILVNNAAFQMTREGIEQIPDGEWERTFRTNIFAMYYLCKAAWPHLQTGQRDHQHRLHPGLPAVAATSSVRQHQGRDRHLLQGAGAGGGGERDPGQRGRPRPYLDPAHPGHHARGEGAAVRAGYASGASRPASGTRPALRLPGLRGVELHHRRGRRSDGRQAIGLERLSIVVSS